MSDDDRNRIPPSWADICPTCREDMPEQEPDESGRRWCDQGHPSRRGVDA